MISNSQLWPSAQVAPATQTLLPSLLVPEFPSLIMLPFVMIVMISAVIRLVKKKRPE